MAHIIDTTATVLPVTQTTTTSDNESVTFQFVAGWMLLFVILYFAAKTRIGYVAIYYSLMLMILFILVTEYRTIVPILNSVQTIGQLNTSTGG